MLGVTQARVSQILSLLTLDHEILRDLECLRDPFMLGYLSERKLRSLLKIRDHRDRLARFGEMWRMAGGRR